MKVNILRRVSVAVGISGVLLMGMSISTNAQNNGNRQQREQRDQEDQQRRQQRINEQEQRQTQYRQQLPDYQRQGRERGQQLQEQKRIAQYRYQQQYAARAQQIRIQNERSYSINRNAYSNAPSNFRYSRNGSYRETNQYGANMLRQAVNYGYQQGLRAGQADRQDRWQSNYQESYGYKDGNYGYSGHYVDQGEYNYYFAKGFRRGYEDGYNTRTQYGSYSSGGGSILGNVLSAILNLEPLR
jgi:multidrug efflux pump subunit AcrA (membrane-fusion protein)